MGLNVAVIGVGRWGRNHARILSSLKGRIVNKLVVVDVDIERAREASKMYSADSYYGSVEELISREKDLDAVIVTVPTVYHYHVVKPLLREYDVFVEKPLAETPEQGLELVRIAHENGRVFTVGHIERFNPIVGVAEKLIKGKGGKILAFEAKRLGPGPAGNYTLNLGVGHDLLVHDVDIANFFLRERPMRVYAIAFHSGTFPYEVEVQAVFEYPGGRTAHLTASWRTSPVYKHRSFSVRTEDSVITVDYILRRILIDNGVESFQLDGLKTSVHSEMISMEISYLQEEPLKLELLDFLEAVKSRREPRVSAIDGYVALKCVFKALESSKKMAPVDITWSELEGLNRS